MNELEVLNDLADGQISIFQAHALLEHHTLLPDKPKKARFVKLYVDPHDESKAVRAFLRILFALPLPLGLVRFAVVNQLHKQLSKNEEWTFEKETLIEMLKYAKDTTITVESKDATVYIKLY